MTAQSLHKLTPREREVLTALARGLSAKEVAVSLGLTIETVRSYTKTIYATLDVHNRAEATMAAVEAGLLERPGASPVVREAIAPPIRPVLGRDKELAILAERLATDRLVSIVGIGGAGKSVLAREAARAHIARGNGEGAFVMLEHVDDEVGLALAIASAFGIHLQRTGADAWREVARLADRRPVLLVLDNLEHLTDHAARIVGLLDALPSLRLLTTSRQALGVAEEVVVRIDGLSVPPDRLASTESYSAVELFLREVERVDVERKLDAQVVGDICRQVGGLPLAIILAAGWIDVLSVEQIAAELAQTSGLLASESVVPPRHRSLNAVVDESIERRPLEQQQVLARLSVFEGGFDRASATIVAGATLQTLAALIRASLVRHDPTSERYDLHPLVRERAAARLAQWNETATARAAHRDHFARFVAGWAEAMAGRPSPPGQREAIAALDRDYGNVRDAWHHAVATDDADGVLAMAHTITMYLDHRSDLMECDRLLSSALTSPAIREAHGPRLWLHREYMRLQSGALDPATCRPHDALATIEARGIDWHAPAEIITAFLEFAAFGRLDDAFERVKRLTAPGAASPYWRHRGQMLLGFIYAAKGTPELAVDAHRHAVEDALASGDYSAAHVQSTFLCFGLLRVNRRDAIEAVLASAERGLARLPHEQTEATMRLTRFILAVFDGASVDTLEAQLAQDPAFARILRENPHLANLHAGAMCLAWGARGDRPAARRHREVLDEKVAAGFFPEAVLWAEMGLAMAAAADGALDDARTHAHAGRAWERPGMVTREVDAVQGLIDAITAERLGDRARASDLFDTALAIPSLSSVLLRHCAAARPLRLGSPTPSA